MVLCIRTRNLLELGRRFHMGCNSTHRIRTMRPIRRELEEASNKSQLMFLNVFANTDHLKFTATRVCVFMHLKCYSTLRRKNTYIKEEDNPIASTEDQATTHGQSGDYIIPNRSSLDFEKSAHKELLNKKRLGRVKKRFPDYVQRIKENRELAKTFNKQRDKVVELFTQPTHTDALFSMKTRTCWGKLSSEDSALSTYTEMWKQLNNSRLSYYNSKLQNTLMLLATYFINSILVEINLRKLFSNEAIDKYSDTFLFRESLMSNIKDEYKKNEIFKILVTLYNKEKSGVPKSFEDFLKNLDQEVITELINKEFKESDNFNSLEFFRYYFTFFKSSQYLNYDHSDTLKFIQSSQPIKFNSTEENNSEYTESFKKLFQLYNGDGELKHLNLIAGLSVALMTCNKYTPNFGIFRYLLDNLGKIGLYNYQSLVYDSLPPLKYKQTILSDPQENCLKSAKVACHFQGLIEADPEFLESLINYQVPRNDIATFAELLAFYRLNEIESHEKMLDKSNLSSLVSKSRFVRSRTIDLRPIAFNTNDPIFVSVNSIYSSIKACIDLKQFQYIDLLFNKIILHSIEKDNQLNIALSFGNKTVDYINSKESSLLIAQNSSVDELSSRVFTKEIFKLLLRACRESDDVGRLMWLTPHLDNYLYRNLEDFRAHLDYIKKHLIDTIIHSRLDKSETQRFLDADSKASVDSQLVSEIHETLSLFRIDGKLLTYDKILDFKNTDSNQVRLTRKKIDKEREIIKIEGGKLNLNHYSDDLYFCLNPVGDYGDDQTKKTYKR